MRVLRGAIAGALLILAALGVWMVVDQLRGGLGTTGKGRPIYWSAYVASLMFFTGVGHGAAWLAAFSVSVTAIKRPFSLRPRNPGPASCDSRPPPP